MTHTPEEIIDKLGQLQADEIARLFRDEGITGRLSDEYYCPVSTYVQAMTGKRAVTYLDHWRTHGEFDPKPLPASVRHFVSEFDSMRLPDLIGD